MYCCYFSILGTGSLVSGSFAANELEFDHELRLLCVFILRLHGFLLGSTVSSHPPKTQVGVKSIALGVNEGVKVCVWCHVMDWGLIHGVFPV